MFPLEVKSGMVARAPIVTPEDTALFASEKGLQLVVLEMLDIMLCFYGLKRSKKGIKVQNERLMRFSLRPYNHNLLRVSRILRSLRLLGCGSESVALFEVLEGSLGQVEGLKRTFTFWHKAVYGPFEFPGPADGPSGTASRKASGASGPAAGPSSSSSSIIKSGTFSSGFKPFFTSKRKAQPDNLQVIRSSSTRHPEHAPGPGSGHSAPLVSSTDPASTSDANVDASRRDDDGSAQTSDPDAQQESGSPSSSNARVTGSSRSADETEPTGNLQPDRHPGHAGSPGCVPPACAMPNHDPEQQHQNASGSGPAQLDSKGQDTSLLLSGQPRALQAAAVSDPGPVSGTAPAISMRSAGSDVSTIYSSPGNHMASHGTSSAPNAPPAVAANGPHPKVVDSDKMQSHPESHPEDTAAGNSGQDL